MCPSPLASIPRPSASQTSSCASYAIDGSLIRGHGPPELIVVPGRPPVVHVRPPFCDDENTRLLEPPPPYQRPDWRERDDRLPERKRVGLDLRLVLVAGFRRPCRGRR